MRCLPRSTTSPASGVSVAGLLLLSLWSPHVQAADDPSVAEAIVRSVQQRMGAGVDVEVSGLRVFGSIEEVSAVRAVPEPGSRVGGRMRFALCEQRSGSRPVALGRAEASVTVRALHPRATRDIARGTVVTEDDMEMVIDSVGRVPLKALSPVMPGMKTLRHIRQGDVLHARMFTGMALVKAGDEVVTRVSVDGVEATGRAIAAQHGQLGRVIRVVNPDSGKRLRGRVVGEREIEVLHGS